MKLDLTITSSGRPDLLQTTLLGLTEKLVPKACFGSVYVNIDPVPPTTLKENIQCVDITKSFFPGAIINLTSYPSFGNAIIKLWKLVSTNTNNRDYFLHFEDDWQSVKKVNLRSVSLMLTRSRSTKQVVLRQEVKSIRKSLIRFQYKSLESNGFKVKMPVFSTSPSFINKEFAGRISELLDPNFHPEKQINNMTNLNITDFIKNYKCRKYIWLNRRPVIQDLGIEWYARRGFERIYVNGVPTYIKTQKPTI